jgi:2-oxoglutarate ferredoxin oxidoreductase subunit gamma
MNGMKQYEMRFTGSGGQGVILASVIMAEAAVLSGEHTIQSQAYGPEARGGTSKAETILSRGPDLVFQGRPPNFLLALTQGSLDKYAGELADGAVVMADDTLEIPAGLDKSRVISVPILSTAKEKVGKAMTANIVAVGAINAALGLFSEEVIREAVRRHIPRGHRGAEQQGSGRGTEAHSRDRQSAFFRSAMRDGEVKNRIRCPENGAED